jgi:SAM-dependent methyltransferase
MVFDREVLENKVRYLDAVLAMPGLVEAVVASWLGEPCRLFHLARPWEPGGGATLFRVESAKETLFVKVKHRSVRVESRLESEPAFLGTPSLQHEYELLRGLSAEWAPRVRFFEERDGFQFLAVEWLEPFAAAVPRLDVVQLLDAWERLEGAVRELFGRGLVHSDIHELNVCFRGDRPVLVDFEEARPLVQDVSFEASLDVAGRNRYGDVGDFPVRPGAVPGRTCLDRLRRVFEGHIRQRLPVLAAACNFDRTCPFNRDPLQEPDSRVYQSLLAAGLRIPGHRPLFDARLAQFTALLRRVHARVGAVGHVDIGSNLGVFCLRAARLPFVAGSTGIEASADYVALARALAFVCGADRVRFVCSVAGVDDLGAAIDKVDLITLLSVYHHVADPDKLLAQIRDLRAPYLLAEFATQERYYPVRGGLEGELRHIQDMTGYRHRTSLGLTRDYRRPLVLLSQEPLGALERAWLRLLGTRLGAAMEALRGWSALTGRRWAGEAPQRQSAS